jgi:hypothetical protein
MATPLHPPSAAHMPPNPGDHADLHVQGYPLLAYLFSLYPRYFHLRRFSGLSVRLLLYRQNELVALEQKLLQLENLNNSSQVGNQHFYNKDFEYVGAERHRDAKELCDLLDRMRPLLKEYGEADSTCTAKWTIAYYCTEESLIRFDTLGLKFSDHSKLKHVQRWLEQKECCAFALSGADAQIWGTTKDPLAHAVDLIQVVHQPEESAMKRLLQDWTPPWAHLWPRWLNVLLHRSTKVPDQFKQYNRSARSFEHTAVVLGNLATSALVYIAVTSLYLFRGEALKIAIVVTVAVVVSLCSILFRNQLFVSMLAT